MTTQFQTYQDRSIVHHKVVEENDWRVKVYLISKNDHFQSHDILDSALAAIPAWIKEARFAAAPTYNLGYLMVHEAREGVFLLYCWWIGGEMVQTRLNFVSYDDPGTLRASPYEAQALMCVWEIEIFTHERAAWIEHVLRKAGDPDFSAYVNDVYKP